MPDSISILCVDDDDTNRILLEGALRDYQCAMLSSGEECLDKVLDVHPDLILLDVEMPGMGGLETCRRLKELSETTHIPVIFLSSHNTLEDRLKGYTAGGDDYISKPFVRDELLAKVKAALKRKELLDQARKEAKDASLSISDIMTTMGEMSTVVNFFQNTFGCKSYESLARRIIDAHSTLGLDIIIEICIDDKRLHFSTTGIESPLEESVFEYIRSKGRLVNCGKRAAVNYPRITIIVRNMPTEDLDFQGRIRDHIALIGQGADAKIKSLRAELLLKQQHTDLIEIISQLEQALNQVEGDYKGQQLANERIFSALVTDIEDSFMAMGMTEQQEEFQRNIILGAEEHAKNLFDAGLALEERFAAIVRKIALAMEQTSSAKDDDEGPAAEDDAIEADAVTLF